jgi:uncharacterized protein with NAD-binding domain and iron-sulfur cluster
MAGLAAAWRLTRPDGPQPEVTVYQRDGCLGGKGASTRGADGRILEHGFHVWLGYYDNSFRLLREVYGELDRDASCPIRSVEDGLVPANTIGLGDGDEDWVATFPANDLVPGEDDDAETIGVGELASRATALLASFGASLTARPRAVLSTRPVPPTGRLDKAAWRRATGFAELIAVMLRGIAADQLHWRGYSAIDDLDFREWLATHGASDAMLEGPLVRGVYDLVFGYEGGDRARPRFAAGAGLHLAGRMFLTYRGAMFWRMTAGMGDVVFAPLYQALRRRGVRFQFFHCLDRIHLSPDGQRVDRLRFRRQGAAEDFEPLVDIGGLPVFPERPERTERPAPATTIELEAEHDFDIAVLAVSLGMIPYVGTELLARHPRWLDLVANVRTVATQSVQLWMEPTEADLGAAHPGAVLTCCGEPFDTIASMSHTVGAEAWDPPVRTSMSLCAVLPDGCTAADVEANKQRFLREQRIWPALTQPRADHVRANTDPSDRYVQSLPGSGKFRLRADGSGVDNLVLAGDWLDTGLNAGCIEAATLSGLQSANVVEGLPITAGTVGFAPQQDQPQDPVP